MTDGSPRIADLRAEARYHRERYDLYRAKPASAEPSKSARRTAATERPLVARPSAKHTAPRSRARQCGNPTAAGDRRSAAAPWRGMFKHTALDQIVGVVATQAHPNTSARRGAVNAPARHLMRAGREAGPTITAVLERGPPAGRRIEVEVVEGRPPKTIDVLADDGSRYRYCLADWVQSGPSAI